MVENSNRAIQKQNEIIEQNQRILNQVATKNEK